MSLSKVSKGSSNLGGGGKGSPLRPLVGGLKGPLMMDPHGGAGGVIPWTPEAGSPETAPHGDSMPWGGSSTGGALLGPYNGVAYDASDEADGSSAVVAGDEEAHRTEVDEREGDVEAEEIANPGPPCWHEVVIKTMLHPIDGR